MSVIFAAVFNRTKAKNKSALYKVNIRVTIDRKSHYLSFQNFPKLKKIDWHKGKIKLSHPHAYELNLIIQNKIRELEGYVIKSLADGLSVTWEGIKAFHDADSSRIDFLHFAREYIRKAKDIKYGTKRSYGTTIGMIENFRSDIQLRDINRNFVENFIRYQKNKPYAAETIRKNMAKFGKLYAEACRLEAMSPDHNLFKALKLPKGYSKQVRLTPEEITKLYKAKLGDGKLSYLRDIFIFQCYTGLYYSDIKLMDHRHVVKSRNGYYLTNGRFKNDKVYVVPLWIYPEQMKLLNKYKHTKGLIFENLPSDQTYNEKLKDMASLAGIEKRITNKMARHSFTENAIALGFPRQFVSRMLGHSREETTQSYYDNSPNLLLQNINRFLAK